MVMRGCCLLVGSCDTVVNRWWNSCCPLPPCCGWDLGSAWTHKLVWSCCVSLGLCWASPPCWWRLFEIVWCFFAFGSCTCPCTRWVYSFQWVFFHRLPSWFSFSYWSFLISGGPGISLLSVVSDVSSIKRSFDSLLPFNPFDSFLWPFLPAQGQLAFGDGLPLYPCCSSDDNQRVTRDQRARSCDLLADPLVALQAHVCLWCGKTHIALSHMVGPHRCVWVILRPFH